MRISQRRRLSCSCEEARRGLLRQSTWEEFLRQGDAREPRIEIAYDEARVRVRWLNELPEQAPTIAKRLIGGTLGLDLRIQVQHGEEWRLDLDGVDGRASLRSSLRIEAAETGCDVLLDGDFRLRGGPLNMAARFEGAAWDNVVRAVLVQDLLPLLCDGACRHPLTA